MDLRSTFMKKEVYLTICLEDSQCRTDCSAVHKYKHEDGDGGWVTCKTF